MRRVAEEAAKLVLGTRAKKTPELDENEWTSLLEGECKEDEWTSLLEDECKEDVKDLEVAKDLGYFPIGATVQFHGLKKWCHKQRTLRQDRKGL